MWVGAQPVSPFTYEIKIPLHSVALADQRHTMSGRKGKKQGGDKDTVTPVGDQKKVQSTQQSKMKAECGDTVSAPAGQTQTVYCQTHGQQTVVKKDQRKKGTKKDSSKK